MSALVLTLAAGLAMADGQGSGLTRTEERGLRLDGQWQGSLLGWPSQLYFVQSVNPDGIVLMGAGSTGGACPLRWVDEGHGRMRFVQSNGQTAALGIYKWQGDCLMICFRPCQVGAGRPTEFRAEGVDGLLILKPAEPLK
jgi:hypothetical protein